ncbi:MAG: ATP-binding protein [Firmicutes bacterium]|nr:ATP-binding protein [Bacillota bacterium]
MADDPFRIPWQQARRHLSADDFATLDGLSPTGLVGQERALEAIEFGLAMRAHLFLVGPVGTGKRTYIRHRLAEWASRQPTPADWCYVPNFAREEEPRALSVPAGQARGFQRAVDEFVSAVYKALRDTFDSDAYARHRQSLLAEFEARQQGLWATLMETARRLGFAVETTPTGQVLAVPLKPDGAPFRPDEFQELPEAVRHRYQEQQAALAEPMEMTLRRVRNLEREAREALAAMDREAAENAMKHLLEAVQAPYQGTPAGEYFAEIVQDVLDHLGDFERDEADRVSRWVLRYRVHVLVEHAPGSGAPVIMENHPTLSNLVGQLNYKQVQGMLVATLDGIVAGSLLKANGGYLIVMADDLIKEPYAYDALKRVLREGRLTIENGPESLSWMRLALFQPEPIPLDVTVVLVGTPQVYYALYNYDPDFRRFFKIKADFAPDMPATEENVRRLARILANAAEDHGQPLPDADALAALVEVAMAMAEDQERLSTQLGEILAVLDEAEVWARQENAGHVARRHVEEAVNRRRIRSGGPADLMHRLIQDGTLIIATEGHVVGQVNGLAVMSAGDAPFGHPSRITATVWAGESGIVNIERQTRQSGTTHSKGVLTLAGFFSGRFGARHPLSFSASIGFEQMYDGVDGDSASSAELYALLSALAGIGVDQGIAVTGSVDQFGTVQPIGGVNHKIEGFFQVCRAAGLSGKQGVMIPRRNLRNLMVSAEVQEALREGLFHIWAVDTVDQGIEILTGMPAGSPEDGPNTVMGRVAQKLAEFYEIVRPRD